MQVYTLGAKTYPEDPARHFDFQRFADARNNFTLIAGIFDFRLLKNIKNSKIVYLELEEPNRFFVEDGEFNHIGYENDFYKIFTLCPYTAAWLNEKYGNNKRTPVFFPFNEHYIPPTSPKEFDVIYMGHAHPGEVTDIIDVISKFNYRFVSHSESPYVTDKDASYMKKLDLISKSRITVVNNSIEVKDKYIITLNKVDGFKKNYAFKQIPEHFKKRWFHRFISRKKIIVPQIKSRVFEAAFCRSLILCREDAFNIIEQFFEPDREFIYYKNGHLEQTINKILKNFDHYESVIENAFQKAKKEYTTYAFYEKFLKGLQ